METSKSPYHKVKKELSNGNKTLRNRQSVYAPTIIILLLLTVAMAAAAWSYMTVYFSGITAKTIEISMQKCVSSAGDQDVLAVVRNMGTATIDIGNDIVIWDKEANVVDPTNIAWADIYGTSLTPPNDKIEPGRDVKVNIFCCSGSGCPKTCTYDIIIGGRSQTATAYCP